jgi:hypothetical protein
MPVFRYETVNAVEVLDVVFNDTKSEQAWMARFPRKTPNQLHKDGFCTVAVWLPGVERKSRAEEGCISILRLFTAPIVDGKINLDLGSVPEPGDAVSKPESLEVPPELASMNDAMILTHAPRVGAKVSPRMPRTQLVAAFALACKKNPKLWDSVRADLAKRTLETKTTVAGGV